MAGADLLPPSLCAKATMVAESILLRLADQGAVDEAVGSARRLAPRRPVWISDASLYMGAAGISVAFSVAAQALDRARWHPHAGRWLRRAAAETHRDPIMRAGVESGTAGIALAVNEYERGQGSPRTALGTVVEKLAEQVDQLGTRSVYPLTYLEYDSMSGRAGILGCACLLAASTPAAHRVATGAISQLTAIGAGGGDSEGVEVAGRARNRWHPWRIWIENFPPRAAAAFRGAYPHGCVDLGFAHGIPGPLAGLACAWRAGYRTTQVEDAVRALASLVAEAAQPDESGPRWPRYLPFDASGDIAPTDATMVRDAYCYGSPGVASSLLDAADVLDDDSLRTLAVDGFHAALRRLGTSQLPVSAHLCHGVAGLLLLCLKFAHRSGSQAAGGSVAWLTEELLERCDERAPLIVRDFQPAAGDPAGTAHTGEEGGAWLDIPGLVQGAAGVALALLSVSTPTPLRWARSLLVV